MSIRTYTEVTNAIARKHSLTKDERDVTRILLEGGTNEETGQALGMDRGAVKWHMHNVYGKTDTSNREGIVRLALNMSIAKLQQWDEKDGNSPGYNLQKAKTYGRLAAFWKDEAKARGATGDEWHEAVRTGALVSAPMSDARLAEMQAEGQGLFIEEMWDEALAEIVRLRAEVVRLLREVKAANDYADEEHRQGAAGWDR